MKCDSTGGVYFRKKRENFHKLVLPRHKNLENHFHFWITRASS
nr:MAG TPA: hypothetical protein [Caudoviricetes sp.]